MNASTIHWYTSCCQDGSYLVIGKYESGKREMYHFSTLTFADLCISSMKRLSPKHPLVMFATYDEALNDTGYVSSYVTSEFFAEQIKLSNILLRSVGLSRGKLRNLWNAMMWGERGRSYPAKVVMK